jgi:peptide-methionine (R)-S-oxide reductase
MLNKVIIFSLVLFTSCQGISQQKKIDSPSTKEKKKEAFPIAKTEAEWRNQLTDIQFYVLRKAGTENPFSSDLLKIELQGVYVCAGCGTELFKSEHKFDSGTGWPSFDREIKGNVAYDVDYNVGYKRTEEHCATCGGHLGHVFDDGPSQTTGKRHCINGAALKFVAAK